MFLERKLRLANFQRTQGEKYAPSVQIASGATSGGDK